MANTKKIWIYSPPVVKATEADKKRISEYFQPLIEQFKKNCIPKKPNKKFNYLIDIYSKWHQNNFYICEKLKAEHPDRIEEEFEVKLVRLTFLNKNKFNYSYLRHTGQWHLVEREITLNKCRKIIESNPIFILMDK